MGFKKPESSLSCPTRVRWLRPSGCKEDPSSPHSVIAEATTRVPKPSALKQRKIFKKKKKNFLFLVSTGVQLHHETNTSVVTPAIAKRSKISRGDVAGQFHCSRLIIRVRIHPAKLLNWFAGWLVESFKETLPHLNREFYFT